MRDSTIDNNSQMYLRFNGSSAANYSRTFLYGYSSSVYTDKTTNQTEISLSFSNSNNATISTFSNTEVYIPNYTNSNYKSIICDGVTENNGTLYAISSIAAGLWSNTSAITSLTIFYNSLTILQYSTFSLYGVLRQGI